MVEHFTVPQRRMNPKNFRFRTEIRGAYHHKDTSIIVTESEIAFLRNTAFRHNLLYPFNFFINEENVLYQIKGETDVFRIENTFELSRETEHPGDFLGLINGYYIFLSTGNRVIMRSEAKSFEFVFDSIKNVYVTNETLIVVQSGCLFLTNGYKASILAFCGIFVDPPTKLTKNQRTFTKRSRTSISNKSRASNNLIGPCIEGNMKTCVSNLSKESTLKPNLRLPVIPKMPCMTRRCIVLDSLHECRGKTAKMDRKVPNQPSAPRLIDINGDSCETHDRVCPKPLVSLSGELVFDQCSSLTEKTDISRVDNESELAQTIDDHCTPDQSIGECTFLHLKGYPTKITGEENRYICPPNRINPCEMRAVIPESQLGNFPSQNDPRNEIRLSYAVPNHNDRQDISPADVLLSKLVDAANRESTLEISNEDKICTDFEYLTKEKRLSAKFIINEQSNVQNKSAVGKTNKLRTLNTCFTDPKCSEANLPDVDHPCPDAYSRPSHSGTSDAFTIHIADLLVSKSMVCAHRRKETNPHQPSTPIEHIPNANYDATSDQSYETRKSISLYNPIRPREINHRPRRNQTIRISGKKSEHKTVSVRSTPDNHNDAITDESEMEALKAGNPIKEYMHPQVSSIEASGTDQAFKIEQSAMYMDGPLVVFGHLCFFDIEFVGVVKSVINELIHQVSFLLTNHEAVQLYRLYLSTSNACQAISSLKLTKASQHKLAKWAWANVLLSDDTLSLEFLETVKSVCRSIKMDLSNITAYINLWEKFMRSSSTKIKDLEQSRTEAKDDRYCESFTGIGLDLGGYSQIISQEVMSSSPSPIVENLQNTKRKLPNRTRTTPNSAKSEARCDLKTTRECGLKNEVPTHPKGHVSISEGECASLPPSNVTMEHSQIKIEDGQSPEAVMTQKCYNPTYKHPTDKQHYDSEKVIVKASDGINNRTGDANSCKHPLEREYSRTCRQYSKRVCQDHTPLEDQSSLTDDFQNCSILNCDVKYTRSCDNVKIDSGRRFTESQTRECHRSKCDPLFDNYDVKYTRSCDNVKIDSERKFTESQTRECHRSKCDPFFGCMLTNEALNPFKKVFTFESAVTGLFDVKIHRLHTYHIEKCALSNQTFTFQTIKPLTKRCVFLREFFSKNRAHIGPVGIEVSKSQENIRVFGFKYSRSNASNFEGANWFENQPNLEKLADGSEKLLKIGPKTPSHVNGAGLSNKSSNSRKSADGCGELSKIDPKCPSDVNGVDLSKTAPNSEKSDDGSEDPIRIEIQRLLSCDQKYSEVSDETDIYKKAESTFNVRRSACLGAIYSCTNAKQDLLCLRHFSTEKKEGDEKTDLHNTHDRLSILFDIFHNCNAVFSFFRNHSEISGNNSENQAQTADKNPPPAEDTKEYITTSVHMFRSNLVKNFVPDAAYLGGILGLGLSNKLTMEMVLTLEKDLDSDSVLFILYVALGFSLRSTKSADFLIYFNRKHRTQLGYFAYQGLLICASLIFENSGSKYLIKILKKEIKKRGHYAKTQCKGNKIWYDESYHEIITICLCLVSDSRTRPFNLANTYFELIINGYLSACTGNKTFVHKLERTSSAPLHEIFYSSLFLELLDFDKTPAQILENMNLTNLMFSDLFYSNILEIYKMSGKIFYMCFWAVKNPDYDMSEELSILFDYFRAAETNIDRHPDIRVILNTLLVTISICLYSTQDVRIARILRRLILKTEKHANLQILKEFHIPGKDSLQFGVRFGDMLLYKICLGIISADPGTHIRFDKDCILNIIVTFFHSPPLSQNENIAVYILRYFLINSIVTGPKSTQFEKSGSEQTYGEKSHAFGQKKTIGKIPPSDHREIYHMVAGMSNEVLPNDQREVSCHEYCSQVLHSSSRGMGPGYQKWFYKKISLLGQPQCYLQQTEMNLDDFYKNLSFLKTNNAKTSSNKNYIKVTADNIIKHFEETSSYRDTFQPLDIQPRLDQGLIPKNLVSIHDKYMENLLDRLKICNQVSSPSEQSFLDFFYKLDCISKKIWIDIFMDLFERNPDHEILLSPFLILASIYDRRRYDM